MKAQTTLEEVKKHINSSKHIGNCCLDIYKQHLLGLNKDKTPTLEEVKEHFKNAKEVKCLSSDRIYDLTKIKIIRDIHEWHGDYWIDAEVSVNNIKIADECNFAEILAYKEPLKQTVKELLKGSEFENEDWSFSCQSYLEYKSAVRFDNRKIKLTQQQVEDIIGYKFEIIKL
jgi:hypothetical protein